MTEHDFKALPQAQADAIEAAFYQLTLAVKWTEFLAGCWFEMAFGKTEKAVVIYNWNGMTLDVEPDGYRHT